jgi:uncharacterized membrane-anchored protein
MPLRTIKLFGTLLPVVLISILAFQTPCHGQSNKNIDWQDGPTTGKLGDVAQISVPRGYRFTGKQGTQKLLELTQNPSNGKELGALIPVVEKGEDVWFVVFEFDDSGYVRDSEKDRLDSDAILKSIQEGTEEANKVRAQRGWTAVHVTGWSKKPYYDPRTHNLTWAVLASSQEQGKSEAPSVNYSVRLLGRGGIMKADLVLSPNQVDQTLPQFDNALNGYTFLPGQTYGDWRSGDKVAKYGLTALIVGGTAAAAVKTGFLLKFWKLIVAAFAAFAAFLKRAYAYIKRLITGKAAEEIPQHE